MNQPSRPESFPDGKAESEISAESQLDENRHGAGGFFENQPVFFHPDFLRQFPDFSIHIDHGDLPAVFRDFSVRQDERQIILIGLETARQDPDAAVGTSARQHGHAGVIDGGFDPFRFHHPVQEIEGVIAAMGFVEI